MAYIATGTPNEYLARLLTRDNYTSLYECQLHNGPTADCEGCGRHAAALVRDAQARLLGGLGKRASYIEQPGSNKGPFAARNRWEGRTKTRTISNASSNTLVSSSSDSMSLERDVRRSGREAVTRVEKDAYQLPTTACAVVHAPKPEVPRLISWLADSQRSRLDFVAQPGPIGRPGLTAYASPSSDVTDIDEDSTGWEERRYTKDLVDDEDEIIPFHRKTNCSWPTVRYTRVSDANHYKAMATRTAGLLRLLVGSPHNDTALEFNATFTGVTSEACELDFSTAEAF
ncbi:hypothetical protein EW026_g7816 [Hermanssonia centrifuga]|uniref:Uncharacterized protein n=1 Tax=Hermanssonia centrifuga TaxID=98765 RepID=A0A4S4K6K0_9APHY|nr:hypothetical protein EW026_g7816 [Hermanssonia centrifuga]